MSGAGKRPIARRFVLVLAAMVIVGAVLGATLDADPGPVRQAPARLTSVRSLGPGSVLRSLASSAASPRCGPASATTIASVDATVAQGIYAAEIHSSEGKGDSGHIKS